MAQAATIQPAITPAEPQPHVRVATSVDHDDDAPGVAGYASPNGLYLFAWFVAMAATFSLPWLLAHGLFAG